MQCVRDYDAELGHCHLYSKEWRILATILEYGLPLGGTQNTHQAATTATKGKEEEVEFYSLCSREYSYFSRLVARADGLNLSANA